MDKLNFEDKTLLVITHNYTSFVKDPVEVLSKYFDHIYVLVRHNPIADISQYLPINYLKPFNKSSMVDLRNKPDNVSVIMTNIIYAPTANQYRKLGDRHFKAVEKALTELNIKFDLVHSHFAWSAGYVGAKLKEKYRVPFIVTAHGFDIYDLPFRDEEWSERVKCVLNTADYTITVSRSNLRCINKLNIETPVALIPNGFNDTLFYPRGSAGDRKTLDIVPDKKMILTVGHLVEMKGHRFLIKAMAEVVEHNRDIVCIIVGDGKLKNELGKQVKDMGLNNYVRLVGGRPHSDVPLWMNACDLFVLPSLRESFGIVQLEAMACGKPVVATYNGGSEEVITSEEYGLLCQPANPKELAEKILIALNKKWDSEKILNYAHRFTWRNIAEETLQVYENVLRNKHQQPATRTKLE